MVPLLAVMVAVIGWPLVDTIHLSFTNARLIGTQTEFVGLANYQKALSGTPFRQALQTTATFALISVAARNAARRARRAAARPGIQRAARRSAP